MLSRPVVLERLATVPISGRRSNEDAQGGVLLDPGARNPFVRGDKPLRPAAVLIPLVERDDGMTVILTRRTDHLRDHSGQISFPGGRVEAGDRDACDTALREAEEEIGLSRRHVEIVGRLDDYIVGTGYLVSPVVGLVHPHVELQPCDGEVAEIFEVPLEFALDPRNVQRHARDYNGAQRHHFAIVWGDYYIWGATAGMLRNLSEALWRG